MRSSSITLFVGVLSLFAGASAVFAQPLSAPSTSVILLRAAEQRKVYISEFRNLLTEETKTFTIFDKKGEPRKTKTVASTFIVYQYSPADDGIAEFRNVLSVDEKPVKDADKRAQEFFEDISKAGSVGKEMEKLEREGSRFDEGMAINGLTLFQAPVLADNMRPYFEFKSEAGETGAESVRIIRYRQVKDNPFISINASEPPSNGDTTLVYDVDVADPGSARPRVSGELWVEADTGRIRRERRTLTVQPEGYVSPVTAADTVLEYTNSGFNVLTPKKITFTQMRISKKPEDTRKEIEISFSYEKFTKPGVEVKEAEVKN